MEEPCSLLSKTFEIEFIAHLKNIKWHDTHFSFVTKEIKTKNKSLQNTHTFSLNQRHFSLSKKMAKNL